MYDTDILAHYGIKGMKWGIRRTPEQLARARGVLSSAKKKITAGVDVAAGRSSEERKERNRRAKVRKNVRTTSDEDLRKEVNRLELEKKFKKLSDEDLRPGRSAVKNFFKSTGGRVITSAAIGTLSYLGYSALHGEPKDPKDLADMNKRMADYIFPNPNKKK